MIYIVYIRQGKK